MVVARVHGLATAAGLPAGGQLRPGRGRRVGRLRRARRQGRAGSARRRWSPSGGPWVASGRSSWPSPATRSTRPPPLDWGLVNRVVPDAELDAAVDDLLGRATRGSASSKALGKRAFHTQIGMDLPQAYAYAVEVMAAASQTPDAQENVAAFLAKRKPVF